MQTAKVPSVVLLEVEKLCHRFLWGECGEERRLHTIKWSTLCTYRNEGGLSFPHLRTMNQALLAKVAWGMLTHPEKVGNRILIDKYGSWISRTSEQPVTRMSVTWRGVRSSQLIVWKGIT